MTPPARLVIHDMALSLDGGTTCLMANDEAGCEHTIVLTQHAFPRAAAGTGELPGRLYFDRQLVPMRSAFEGALLFLLRSADVPDDLIRPFVARTVSFVESEEYLRFAERVEPASSIAGGFP